MDKICNHHIPLENTNKVQDTRAIQAHLGHANIKNTVIYIRSPQQFKNFWQD